MDPRARRYALRAVQPSPARQDAPEPDAWLPIDLTAELEALDLTGELELLRIEEGRVDLDRELEELEADFWRTAEQDHPFLTGALPVTAAPPVEATPAPEAVTGPEAGPEPITLFAASAPAVIEPPAPDAESAAVEVPAPLVAALDVDVEVAVEPELDPLPVPEEYRSLRPTRPAIAHHRRAVRLRRRFIVTVLVVALAAAFVGVTAQIVGGTHPRRDVTVSVDGRASTIVTRAGTVADLLAAEGVVVHAGDRVVPSLSTSLEQGMPIRILRAFPVTVDIDGTVAAHRTIHHDVAGLRKQLAVGPTLVRVDGRGRIARRARVVFRTPHDVTLAVDGTTTPLPRQTALTVGELLGARGIALDGDDQVEPALGTHLAAGSEVHVFRLAADQVVESKSIPFSTQLRDDPALAAGHTRTIQAGRNGVVKVISKVVKKDGVAVQWTEVGRDVVQAPVTQILARGTKRSGTNSPVAAPATGRRPIGGGYATWYQSHAGPGSCAHLTLPFGTIVHLRASNGRTAQCRVGDRGPQAWTGNSIDLNPDVFQQLAPLGTGRIYVAMSIDG